MVNHTDLVCKFSIYPNISTRQLQKEYHEYLEAKLRPLIEPVMINVKVTTPKDKLKPSLSRSKLSQHGSRVKLHLQTHLVLEASLTKTN